MTKTKTFLKGFLMGTCDLIPGISGGTVAFILGIYIKLIQAVKNITPKNITSIFKKPSQFKKLNFQFLTILLLGILIAIIILSKPLLYLIQNHTAPTLAFFSGLILASSKIIFNHIDDHKLKNQIFLITGILIGIIISLLTPLTITNPSHPYIFFSGLLAISAMFLPGISGSFILLIVGTYEFILKAIQSPIQNYSFLLVFITGAIIGAALISRTISYLYKIDKSKTLYTLLGLVIGSLLTPIQKITDTITSSQIPLSIILFGIGVLMIIILEKREF